MALVSFLLVVGSTGIKVSEFSGIVCFSAGEYLLIHIGQAGKGACIWNFSVKVVSL